MCNREMIWAGPARHFATVSPFSRKDYFRNGEKGYFILNASLRIAISNNYFLTVDIIVTDLSNIT